MAAGNGIMTLKSIADRCGTSSEVIRAILLERKLDFTLYRRTVLVTAEVADLLYRRYQEVHRPRKRTYRRRGSAA